MTMLALAPLILASGSASRRTLLEAAGLDIRIDPPGVDEAPLKRDARAQGLPVAAAAEALAQAKAEAVWRRHAGLLVLAADQMLECGDEWFDKPEDRAAASAQLARLSGRSHRLVTAAAVWRDGACLWRHTDTAELTMRPLTPGFIDAYLDQVGDRALSSVGAYQLEGLGIQLFSAVAGSHFTILGLPMLPLLEFLRSQGVVRT